MWCGLDILLLRANSADTGTRAWDHVIDRPGAVPAVVTECQVCLLVVCLIESANTGTVL